MITVCDYLYDDTLCYGDNSHVCLLVYVCLSAREQVREREVKLQRAKEIYAVTIIATDNLYACMTCESWSERVRYIYIYLVLFSIRLSLFVSIYRNLSEMRPKVVDLCEAYECVYSVLCIHSTVCMTMSRLCMCDVPVDISSRVSPICLRFI